MATFGGKSTMLYTIYYAAVVTTQSDHVAERDRGWIPQIYNHCFWTQVIIFENVTYVIMLYIKAIVLFIKVCFDRSKSLDLLTFWPFNMLESLGTVDQGLECLAKKVVC